ncbi:cell division protein FtsK [Vibrio albus]|uniref:DNA translocase FtsK n=1 Tax=Vibrio albus TaxID=2200953 RepID=A0A2U3BAT5_9VIBR|nr:DNA translocase FtsK 4TM domain-containing protein [Vibrio albus]PWI33898.1 cell division protein FtsK [Vibrio albus]
MFRESKNKVEMVMNTGNLETSHRLNGAQRLRECCFIVGFLAAILLAVALYSFNPADPSWSQTAWGGEVKNAGGRIGAWTADSLFFTFGLLAYSLPAVLAALTWVFFRKRSKNEPLDFMLWGTRLLGLVVLILTSSGLAALNFDDIWYFSSGGVVGDVLTSLALPYLNLLGSIIVFLFLWGAGFTLLTGISWLSIVEWIGNISITATAWFLNKVRGSEKETLEPARESFTAEHTEPEQISSDMTLSDQSEIMQEEPEEQQPQPSDDETEHYQELEEKTHRYNIHMPDAVDDLEQREEALESEQPEPSLRSQQLHTTIEELEKSALEQGDMPDQVESETAKDVQPEESVYNPLADIDLETEKQPVISAEALDHVIDDADMQTGRIEPVISDIESVDIDEPELDAPEVTEPERKDPDVAAFQNIVSEAQKNMAGAQNPFLAKKEEDLPVPTAPMPTLELLYHPDKRENHIDRDALEDIARLVESKLADYKIKARVVDIFPGPVITRFELDLAPGVKVSRISSLSMDLARSLSAMAVRVVEVIPGKPYVGLELPNMSRQTVYFSDVVGSKQFLDAKSPTTVVMGQDIAGEAVIADIAKMPHVLVAGTTGSGKSVGVNVMILSMLYKAKPEDLRFIMIDPKMLELSVYEGIPHLLSEVVTDMKDASNALRWCVGEMERRYKLMSALGVRNVKGFNEKLKMAADAGHPIHDPLWQPGDSMDQEPPLLEKLPYIVVVVDEFADLMMVVGKKVEELIARLAQKARAAGIHLILATQRPSVDVITGLIKANIPTRVAFTVSTKTDSRTILDQGGAESLLGMGDMLYLPPGSSHTVRVHGAFASDDDVHAVVNDWKARGKPQYIDEITNGDQSPDTLLPGEQMEGDDDIDPLFDQVVEFVVESRRASVSGVQRRFKVGYNRASRIVEQMEMQGIVTPQGHNGNREVLAPKPVTE